MASTSLVEMRLGLCSQARRRAGPLATAVTMFQVTMFQVTMFRVTMYQQKRIAMIEIASHAEGSAGSAGSDAESFDNYHRIL